MKINNIQYPVFNPYNKPTYEIYVAGCTNACPECHLKELWDFDNGEEVTEDFFQKMEERRKWFDCISILGGDLLCQPGIESLLFVEELFSRFPEKEFWLFTGKNCEELPYWVFHYFDTVKTGKYDQTKKVDGFPASSNQMVWHSYNRRIYEIINDC